MLNGKNYFDMNLGDLTGFEERYFAWTGFPASKSKSKTIHRSKSKEALEKQFIHAGEDGYYFKNIEYLTIVSELKGNDKTEITGSYERKDTFLKYAGRISMGPMPAGMSGGAMYFFRKEQELDENLDNTFRFAGIGIKYRNDNTIVGVPRVKIIELIERFERENPLRMIVIDSED
ncbi:MAG: hypothetical protein B7Z57_14205 [Acidiphilium sp. 37-60-79]|nr:MAG: hypothetical protein B7Z57_14205 [Acidiphilium sp. 37-60-79]